MVFWQEPEAVGSRGKHGFFQAHLGRWPVSAMCRALVVSQQGYYRAIRRAEPGWRDRQLLKQIYACLREDEENSGNYRVRTVPSSGRRFRFFTARRRHGLRVMV